MDDSSQCDKIKCVSAIGDFFFNRNGLFYYSQQLFQCCPNSETCFGNLAQVFSPWACLGKSKGLLNWWKFTVLTWDPFISCNKVYDECQENISCSMTYNKIEQNCPRDLFESDFNDGTKCPEINSECEVTI